MNLCVRVYIHVWYITVHTYIIILDIHDIHTYTCTTYMYYACVHYQYHIIMCTQHVHPVKRIDIHMCTLLVRQKIKKLFSIFHVHSNRNF